MHILSDIVGRAGMAALFRGDLQTASLYFTIGTWLRRAESILSYTLPGFLLGFYTAGGFND